MEVVGEKHASGVTDFVLCDMIDVLLNININCDLKEHVHFFDHCDSSLHNYNGNELKDCMVISS